MALVHFHTDEIELPMVDACLGADSIRKALDGARLTSQEHRLEAMLVIQMRVHARNDEVVLEC
jgi:hypothetical protein